jgi:hypothetical protein
VILATNVIRSTTSVKAATSSTAIMLDNNWLGPAGLAVSEDAKTLLIACGKAQQVEVFDLVLGKSVRAYPLPGPPSGLTLDSERARLYVTCAAPESRVCEIDLSKGAVAADLPAGHTALSPVLSADGNRLFVCLRFDNQIAWWDTATRREAGRVTVGREPVSLALTPDGQFLFVAHHLPSGRADAPIVAATIGIVDVQKRALVKELNLPNGSSIVREIRLSPDGRYAAVAHNLAHFQVPATQLDRGWLNTSALTLIAVAEQKILGTVALDEVDRGAANPWAIAWTTSQLLVTHAGTHELSVIDFPGLLGKLTTYREAEPAANDLAFLEGLRRRLDLSVKGPRSLVVAADSAYVAGYFSDSVDTVKLNASPAITRSIPLLPPAQWSALRQGEFNFNDASLCFERWQSCATCHSDDARVDGFNWDLLNDGIGNPKNTKSLLLSHRTPPAMSTGARETAEAAVRAGIQHILFAVPAEAVAAPMDDWLKSLHPIPSPRLAAGKLSPAALRGRKLFTNPKVGCARCHPPGLFTDLATYDVGTSAPTDGDVRAFDTPTLVELWRTAPYLHDGSAATVREVLTTRNAAQQHGRTGHLSAGELDDLIEYLLSL